MRDFVIRAAKNEEGLIVEKLVKEGTNFQDYDGWDIDWTDIEPYWLVAEVGRRDSRGSERALGEDVRGNQSLQLISL